MSHYLSKFAILAITAICAGYALQPLGAEKATALPEEQKRSEELAKIRGDLQTLQNENKKLEAEIGKLRQQDNQSSKERIFVDARAGGSLGLTNLAGSGIGYMTGFEFRLGAGFSALFRFANGQLSIATADFNSRVASDGIKVTGTGNVTSTYFSMMSGLAYELFASDGFSLGVGAGIAAKKLTGSLFEAPLYPAAEASLFAWYRLFTGIDVGLCARFEYGKISQIAISGSNVLFGDSKSANELGLMLALRFAVL